MRREVRTFHAANAQTPAERSLRADECAFWFPGTIGVE